MKHLAFIALIAGLGLAGCNLSETERMDLNRREVSEIACRNPDVRFAGSDSIPLTILLQASYDQGLAKHFELIGLDQGTVPRWYGDITARIGDQPLFRFVFETASSTERVDAIYRQDWKWAESFESITFTLSPTPCRDSETRLDLHVRDDRPRLAILFRNDTTRLRTGDTLKADLTNRSTTDTIDVASDYRGLRLVGDYVVSVKPGETRRMEWIAVAPKGQSGWLDLSWGRYGQSRRLEFNPF